MIISLILLLVFIFIAIGSILWVIYDYNKTVNEIKEFECKKEQIAKIIENGLTEIIKDIEERA